MSVVPSSLLTFRQTLFCILYHHHHHPILDKYTYNATLGLSWLANNLHTRKIPKETLHSQIFDQYTSTANPFAHLVWWHEQRLLTELDGKIDKVMTRGLASLEFTLGSRSVIQQSHGRWSSQNRITSMTRSISRATSTRVLGTTSSLACIITPYWIFWSGGTILTVEW